MKFFRKYLLDELTYIIQEKTQNIYRNASQTFEENKNQLKKELDEIYKKTYPTEILKKRLNYIDNVENLQKGYIPSIITGLIASLILYLMTDTNTINIEVLLEEFFNLFMNVLTDGQMNFWIKIFVCVAFLIILLITIVLLFSPIIIYTFFLFSNKALVETNDLLLTYEYERKLLIKAMNKSKRNPVDNSKHKNANQILYSDCNEDSKFDRFKLEIITIIAAISITGVILCFNPVIDAVNKYFQNGYTFLFSSGFILFYLLFSFLFKRTKLHNIITYVRKNETKV